MLRIVRYSDTVNWGSVGQFFSVRPEFGGLRVLQYLFLYPPEEALAAYVASGNWDKFKQDCRPWFNLRRPELAKLVKDINSQRMTDFVFLVSDEEYERSYEWMVEQFLVKGFRFDGVEHRIEREVTYILSKDKKQCLDSTESIQKAVEVPVDKPKDNFVNLHLHSNYSDGLPSIEQIVKAAVDAGQPAVAISDHGNMFGVADLYEACKKFGIKFIAGNETYLEHAFSALLQTKQANAELQGDYKHTGRFHQLVLAKNFQGYKNLSKLTTWSELYNKKSGGRRAYPLITLEKLEELKEGLIVTSGCIGSLVPQLIINGEQERAREILEWYQKTFGDDFYIELQDHDALAIYKTLNYALVEMGQAIGCRFIITADSHYLKDCHYEVHSVLYCIKYGKTLAELENDSFRYDRDLTFGNSVDLAQRFDYLSPELVDEAIANTVKLAYKTEEYELFRDPSTPEFELPPGHTYESYFTKIAEEGLRERFKGQEIPEEYKSRLKEELRVINSMGFASYFLVVADYIRHANEQGIRVGVGRGSAAGSLAAYATKITGIDPIHYGLSFGRFLNEGRREMPDIDTDFHPDGREEMIRYVTDKYGSKRVAQICTYGRLKSRAAIKGVARALQIPPKAADEVSKSIPVSRGKPTKLSKMIADDSPVSEFRDRYRKDSEFKRWIDLAIQVEGCLSNTGVHAAGVVIAGSDIEELIPLMRTDDGTVVTQYEMGMVDKFGFLKMDFLGLINLAIMDEATANIQQNRGVTVDVDALPMDDPKTYALFSRGDTADIFQFGSSGMQSILKQLQPTTVEDLAVVNALYRPGALDSGMIPRYIARKHGKEEVEYDFPELQEALQDTYGVLVYQESVMKSSQVLAGFSATRADQLRSVVGKKKMDKMPKERADFVAGGKGLGFDEEKLNFFFDKMETFGEYGFNKSHAVAYAYTAYQCAYLKANYAAEYIAALLSRSDVKKARQFLQVAKQSGIEILPPDINISGTNFTPKGDTQIFFGLRLIRDLGEAAINSILEARIDKPFESLTDVYQRTNVNTRGLAALVYAGAFDSLYRNRKQVIESISLLKDWENKLESMDTAITRTTESIEKRYAKLGLARDRQALEAYVSENEPLNKTKASDVEFIVRKERELAQIYDRVNFHLAEVEGDYDIDQKLRKELEFLGFFITCNPVSELPEFESFPVVSEEESTASKEWVKVSCSIVKKQHKIAKNSGNPRYELVLEDHRGTLVSAVAYHSALAKPKVVEAIENKLAFTGKFRVNYKGDEEEIELILNDVVF